MIAEIIPRLRSIRKLEILDYLVPAHLEIQPGMTVEIPFRFKSIYGVVVKLKTSSEAKRLKSVTSVVANESSVSPLQIGLVYHLAKLTGAPLSTALLSVLQFGQLVPLKIKQKPSAPDQPETTGQISHIRKQRIPVIKKVVRRIQQLKKPIALRYSSPEELLTVISLLCSTPGQHLILVPHEEALRWWASHLHHKQPIIFSSSIKRSEQQTIIIQLRTGCSKVIVGTRNAIFLPPDHLTSIIVVDEENQAYHQDQNPRFQTTELATWLAEQLSIPCLLTSQSPKIATAYTFPLLDISLPPTQECRIIDLQAWRTSGGSGLVTPDFLQWQSAHLPVVLIYNRKGTFRWLRCQDCQQIMPMSELVTCPHCQSIKLKPGGLGNEKVEELLGHLLPDFSITHWDADSDSPAPQADILLTTSYALPRLEWRNFKGIGVISVDHQLAIPDFRSNERVLSFLTQLIRTGLPFCIQTSSPDHPVIEAAINQNYAGFYDYELSIRKKLKYPPFGILVEYIDTKTKTKTTKKFARREDIPPPLDGVVLDILE